MHRFTHTSTRFALVLGLLGAAGLAGCGDSTTTPPADAGTSDLGNPVDSGPPVDSGTPTDVVSPTDEGTPTDVVTPTDAGPVMITPRNLALSAAGHDRFYGVAYDAQGNFYAVGVVADGTAATDDQRTVVAKFNAQGELDTTFGTNGIATHNLAMGGTGEVLRGIVVQPSGRIVISGVIEAAGAMDARDRNLAVARLMPNGTLDTSFGTGGLVTLDLGAGGLDGTTYVADNLWSMAQYPDGRLVLCGSTRRTGGNDSDFVTVRLTVDGARDATFATNGVFTLDIDNRSGTPRTSTVLPDGSIISNGYMTDGGVIRPVIYKLTPAGVLDTTFGTMGIFQTPVLMAVTETYAAVLQGTNLVTTGYGRNGSMENLDWLSLRLTSNGALDTTFGTNGYVRVDLNNFNDNARTLVALPDNRLFMVGGGRPTETNSDGMVGMLTANGARDTTFGTNGLMTFDLGGGSDFFWGVALSPMATHAAVVGSKGVGTTAGEDDDAVVLLVPLTR